MSLEIKVTQEARCTHVMLQGQAGIGHLLSLLQVLEIDSASWPGDAVLIDLRGLQAVLGPDDQSRLAAEAAHWLRRMARIALLAPPGHVRDGAGVRAFHDEEEARRWLHC